MPPSDAGAGENEAKTGAIYQSEAEEDSPFADVIADAVVGTPAQREMWLFLNSVPSKTGFRRYAAKYELLTIILILVLLIQDIVTSIKEVGDVLNSTPITKYLEYFAYVIFTTEYVFRLWSCMASKALNNGSCKAATLGRMKFGVSGLLLVDFVVLGAFYLQIYMSLMVSGNSGSRLQGLQVLRMFRAFRAFRSAKMLKMDRKANALAVLLKVLESEVKPILATLTIAFMLVIILATIMYYIENEGQPEAYSSIPAAMWWSVTALTSVGYGDVYPITASGKILGCFACVVGAGIIALPTGILSNGFNEEISMAAEEKEAEVLEESVLEATRKLDGLRSEVESLYESLDEIDVSQRHLLRGLRRMFPEKVMEILGPSGPEEEEPLEKDSLHDIMEAEEKLDENDLNAIRDRVERDVAEIKTRSRRRRFNVAGPPVLMRAGLGLHSSSSS